MEAEERWRELRAQGAQIDAGARAAPGSRHLEVGREGTSVAKPLGVVWVDCPRSVVSAGLVRALEKRATVHQGPKPPEDVPSCVILCANSREGLSEHLEFYRELSPDAPPIVVFSPQLDLPLARDALQAGASGFVHAEMMPEQLVRALAVAAKGELVAPRELLKFVLANGPIRRPRHPLSSPEGDLRLRGRGTLKRGDRQAPVPIGVNYKAAFARRLQGAWGA